MDLQSLLRVLVRRWWLVAPLFVATGLLIQSTVSAIDPVHETEGSLLLVGPVATGTENPLLEFTRSLDLTAQVLATVVEQPEHADELERRGLSGDFSIDVEVDAPILTVTARAADSGTSIATAAAVIELLTAELDARQRAVGAPEHLFIRTHTLLQPTRSSELTINQLRAAVAIAALGVASTAALAVGVDRLLGRRRAAAERRRLRQLPVEERRRDEEQHAPEPIHRPTGPTARPRAVDEPGAGRAVTAGTLRGLWRPRE